MKKGFFQSLEDKYQKFSQTNFAQVMGMTGRWAYKLRSVLLSIPVAVVALALAVRNLSQLPTEVGIHMLANGQYQWMISRGMAACIPVAVTAVCLVMMFLSKKVLYPWLISVFSLVLPIALWFTYLFPG